MFYTLLSTFARYLFLQKLAHPKALLLRNFEIIAVVGRNLKQLED
jgi:hypothetical protein